MLKNKKLVIFDMDGCLIDSENLYTKIWGIVFEENEIPIDQDEIKSWRGKGWGKIRTLINEFTHDDDLTLSLREQREKLFYDYLNQDKLKLKPYALEFIDFLLSNDIHIAVGTSTYSDKGLQILDHFKLIDKLDKIVFGDEVENTKPNPDIYLKIYESFDLKKEEVIIFEDSKSGIKAANNAKIDVIYVPDEEMIDTNDLKILKVIKNFGEVM